jgi:hypothetical protein
MSDPQMKNIGQVQPAKEPTKDKIYSAYQYSSPRSQMSRGEIYTSQHVGENNQIAREIVYFHVWKEIIALKTYLIHRSAVADVTRLMPYDSQGTSHPRPREHGCHKVGCQGCVTTHVTELPPPRFRRPPLPSILKASGLSWEHQIDGRFRSVTYLRFAICAGRVLDAVTSALL